ncbi:flagellar biosynthesis protein FlhF [Propionivibrio dicarboxylicus]|uniref:Flagellar biosynthesis protein FlhF n=1 Tax=Propionivibrio dicarboxylicus TaxID=83767 RepID=A0A1G8HG07_9RHOO|nr:flagellar biosynthesis protein FlhF [Propionivibrio dicarboxylicus]SDI05617.1 flagellar biosynthesis protein FlhF [Propionivibrio dicarboxylicus]
MNVRKFIAATARDALRKVKEMLGPDAIILSNRAIPGGVEIMAVAAGEMDTILPPPVVESRLDDDYTVHLSAERLAAPTPAPVQRRVEVAPPPLSPRPAPQIERPSRPAMNHEPAEVITADMMEEIRSLRRIVEQHLAGAAWGESARSEPVKTEVLRQMLDAGFSPSLARELLNALPGDLSVAKAIAWVKQAADRALVTLPAEADIVDRGGIYALVGPTGVGKTTTTAKLAARCVLRHGAGKVALITTDGYRIGAYEQLRIYGRILGVSVYLVKDAQELKQTLVDLQHKHMVLIDTMGMSQRDSMVGEQVAMFGANNVKRLLLLAATGRGDTLDDVVRAYGGPDLAGCILSKIDEAAGLAASLDTVIRNKLTLHYVSNGQRVPEDLHLPNRTYLLHRAFKDVPEASPHRLDGVEPGLVMSATGMTLKAAGGRRG